MKTDFLRRFVPAGPLLAFVCLTDIAVRADTTPQTLPFGQNWSDASLITTNNDWSGVPGITGYRGDKLTSRFGLNPQTIVADGTTTPLNVIANRASTDSVRSGGIVELDGLADPVVALKGSATASAPFLLLALNTSRHANIVVSYNLRDVDSSAADASQAVAFQYRVGTNGVFTDIAAAFVPDATTGPQLATQINPVTVILPAEANDQPVVHVRWITANAAGNDEWVGIDDISVTGEGIESPAPELAVPELTVPELTAPKPPAPEPQPLPHASGPTRKPVLPKVAGQ